MDTHSDLLNIALFKDKKFVDKIEEKDIQRHSELTLHHIKQLLDKYNLTPDDLDTIMVVNGPGSFTGIRISLTIVKILARYTNAKIIPVSSLKALALSSDFGDYIVPIIEYKKNKMYTSVFNKNYEEHIVEQFIYEDEFNILLSDIKNKSKFVALHNYEIENINIFKINFDYQKIHDYYINNSCVDPINLDANYLKEI